MPLYVQVVNGLIKNLWDSPPPSPVGEDGWMNAVDVVPTITFRQQLGDRTYDIGEDIVTISREVIEIPFEIKKQSLISENIARYESIIEIMSKAIVAFPQQLIDDNRNVARQNEDAILAATTYEELESVVLLPFKLF